jgi:hypothetical protein
MLWKKKFIHFFYFLSVIPFLIDKDTTALLLSLRASNDLTNIHKLGKSEHAIRTYQKIICTFEHLDFLYGSEFL